MHKGRCNLDVGFWFDTNKSERKGTCPRSTFANMEGGGWLAMMVDKDTHMLSKLVFPPPLLSFLHFRD